MTKIIKIFIIFYVNFIRKVSLKNFLIFLALSILFISACFPQSNYDIIFSRSDITGLTGGGTNNLDGVSTTNIRVGTMVLVDDGTQSRLYKLCAGTDAENPPSVVRPDDYASPGNEKVWKLSISSNPDETGYSGAIQSGMYVAFDDSGTHPGYTYTGYYDIRSEEKWEVKTGMSTSRWLHAAAELNGILYVMGGNGAGDLSSTEAYDPVSDSWTGRASMNTRRREFAAASANGHVYVFAGIRDDIWLNSIESYDPTTNTWTVVGNIGSVRKCLTATTVDGYIYIIGGRTGALFNPQVNWNQRFDPATNSVISRAGMITARYSHAAAAANGKIYVIGGMTGSNLTLNTNQEYDPSTNSWANKTPMPAGKNELAAASVRNRIYAIGGWVPPGNAVNHCIEYNPLTDSWTWKQNMAGGRYSLAAASCGYDIFVFGGNSGSSVTSTTQKYRPLNVVMYWFKKD